MADYYVRVPFDMNVEVMKRVEPHMTAFMDAVYAALDDEDLRALAERTLHNDEVAITDEHGRVLGNNDDLSVDDLLFGGMVSVALFMAIMFAKEGNLKPVRLPNLLAVLMENDEKYTDAGKQIREELARREAEAKKPSLTLVPE